MLGIVMKIRFYVNLIALQLTTPIEVGQITLHLIFTTYQAKKSHMCNWQMYNTLIYN
jgi:hypothetical protein